MEQYFKKKICILGGIENYKDEFQKRISSNCLPIENKQNIGVNISRIDFLYESSQKFEFLLWNIDCGRQRAFLRTIFYAGAEAMIIFISEMKVNQIRHYFNEIQSRFPEITLIFCVILEKRLKEEIMNTHFKNEDFNSMVKTNNIQFKEIAEPSVILEQICTIFMKRIKHKEINSVCIIDFIPLDLLIGRTEIRDECNDYYEPETHDLKARQIINAEQLVNYILKLKLEVEFESTNWIKIKNNELGTFSIFLKNGNVYYFPQVCEKCKDKECFKYKKAPFYICIESGDSIGWTNINGFDQSELLILTKILALKEGNEDDLPKSIVKQIKRINKCEKKRKLK